MKIRFRLRGLIYCSIFFLICTSLSICWGQRQVDNWASVSSARWLPPNQTVVVEFPDLGEFINGLRKTDFFTNQKWEVVESNLTDEEFGFLNRDQWEFLQDQLNEGLSLADFGNCVFSSKGPGNWTLILETSFETRKQLSDWFDDTLRKFSKLQTNDHEQPGDWREPAAWNFEEVEKVGSVTINQIDRYFVLFFEGVVVVASRLDEAVSVCERLQGSTEASGKRFVDSRKYRTIRQNLVAASENQTSNQMFCYLDPKLIWELGGWFDEKQRRIWGLNELLASGVTVKLVPSRIRDGQFEFVVEAIIKPSTPRVGIAKAIRLKGTPGKLRKCPISC